MQSRALNSRMNMDRPIPIQRLVTEVSDKAQQNTQQYGGRPFGVGMLIAGCDETGTHLFEFNPSGTVFDYQAMAIGARSQSARTYLEKYRDSFPTSTLPQLILHALHALRDTLPPDQQAAGLTVQNVALGWVGCATDAQIFTILEDDQQLQALLNQLPAIATRQTEEVVASETGTSPVVISDTNMTD